MSVLPIVFENEEIIIVNKPKGVAVQGGEGVKHPLDEVLAQQVGYKIYPVHRLDKDTSGLLVVAKNSKAAHTWIELIAGGKVKKVYNALCFGLPKNTGCREPENAVGKTGTFTAAVGKDKKPAFTSYKILKSKRVIFKNPSSEAPGDPLEGSQGEKQEEIVSLLELQLGTGRMHQIRIHLSQEGCPIVADDKYGLFKKNKQIKKLLGIKDLQLVALRLQFPLGNTTKTLEIPLPDHMKKALESLEM